METQTIQSENRSAPPVPAATSCRKKKSEQASFLEDMKDHIDEASMDDHKYCFKNTIQKMFSMSKVIAEKSAETKEVESSLPLKPVAAE